jgi:hypothetical protein
MQAATSPDLYSRGAFIFQEFLTASDLPLPTAAIFERPQLNCFLILGDASENI